MKTGEREIFTLDLCILLNISQGASPRFATLEAAKPIDDLKGRLKILIRGKDKAGEFYRQFHYAVVCLCVSPHS